MASRSAILLVCAVAQGLTACALERPTAERIGSIHALATPSDVRIITERGQPTRGSPMLCAEPSPDISKALSTLAKASGGSGSLQGGGGVSTSESISMLAGRTAGVVALRDGLFRACEAYANGIIGPRAYALILSQYGNLLVTLMLSEDASGASGVGAASRGPAAAAPNADIGFPTIAAPAAAQKPAATIPPAGAASNGNAFAHDAVLGDDAAADQGKPDGDATSAKDHKNDLGNATGMSIRPKDGAEAVAAIAKMYFDSALMRSGEAEFVACIADRPDAIKEVNSTRPEPADADFKHYCEGVYSQQLAFSAEARKIKLDQLRAEAAASAPRK